jgi:hypothetical protein
VHSESTGIAFRVADLCWCAGARGRLSAFFDCDWLTVAPCCAPLLTVLAEDGRANEELDGSGFSLEKKAAFDGIAQAANGQVDYGRLWDDTCDQESQNAILTAVDALAGHANFWDGLGGLISFLSPLLWGLGYSMKQTNDWLLGLSSVGAEARCFSNYLKSDLPNTHGFELLEWMVRKHVL